MEEIIVFDFDKTLTNYDTTLPFFVFCCGKNKFRFLFLPFFFLIKVLSKFKVISIKQEKEIGIILFCPKNYQTFKEYCKEFSNSIKLNDIYYNLFQSIQLQPNKKIIIASASFKDYLTPLFPDKQIIASTLKCDNKNLIKGIAKHPYSREKATLLEQFGYNKISIFYTDSKSDIPTSKFSEKTNWVKKGKIIHQS